MPTAAFVMLDRQVVVVAEAEVETQVEEEEDVAAEAGFVTSFSKQGRVVLGIRVVSIILVAKATVLPEVLDKMSAAIRP